MACVDRDRDWVTTQSPSQALVESKSPHGDNADTTHSSVACVPGGSSDLLQKTGGNEEGEVAGAAGAYGVGRQTMYSSMDHSHNFLAAQSTDGSNGLHLKLVSPSKAESASSLNIARAPSTASVQSALSSHSSVSLGTAFDGQSSLASLSFNIDDTPNQPNPTRSRPPSALGVADESDGAFSRAVVTSVSAMSTQGVPVSDWGFDVSVNRWCVYPTLHLFAPHRPAPHDFTADAVNVVPSISQPGFLRGVFVVHPHQLDTIRMGGGARLRIFVDSQLALDTPSKKWVNYGNMASVANGDLLFAVLDGSAGADFRRSRSNSGNSGNDFGNDTESASLTHDGHVLSPEGG